RRLGRYEEAVPLLVDVLEARKADPDTDPELLAQAYNHLGLAYWRLLRYDDAESALRASRRLREAADSPAALAETANNLAVLLQSRQRDREALPLLEQALALFEQALGPEHPRVASVLSNLAGTHERLDTWSQAEPLLRRAIALAEASFGRHHFQPLNPRTNLIQVLRIQHRHDEAYAEAQHILDVAESLDDPLVLARALYTMGRSEWELERPADAEASFGRCERLVAIELGAEHLQARKCRVWRARALVFSGRVDVGLARLHALAVRYARDLPRHHRDRRDVAFALGVVTSRTGDSAAAIRHYTDYLDAVSEITPTRHRAIAHGRHALGVALAEANDPRAAEVLRQALDGRIRQYGPEHPWVAESAFALGRLEKTRQNVDAACALFDQASSIRRRWFRPDDPDRQAAEEASAACPVE
ncbi:MAG: tetratricopeptide repeat protein, partial [Acidobacteriota bacterium]